MLLLQEMADQHSFAVTGPDPLPPPLRYTGGPSRTATELLAPYTAVVAFRHRLDEAVFLTKLRRGLGLPSGNTMEPVRRGRFSFSWPSGP
jgi:hypothetical protein